MKRSILLCLLLASASPCFAETPAAPAAAEIRALKRETHPRILTTAQALRELKERASSNAEVAKMAAQLREQANALLKEAPSKYEIPDGKRLLATSRRVFERALTLGLAFQLTGDRQYAERLWKELETAANFKDWNPSHFLDTAEMTAAFAVGFDWLHAEWTPQQREILRTAIVKKGLNPSLNIYRGDRGWAAVEHNWNQVCNGGMTLGALAVLDEEPELASEILQRAIATVPRAMKHFAPDGAWGEGPAYWDYATRYNALMLAALDSAFGRDFGLSRIEGFGKAPDFPILTNGPIGRSFNYADAADGAAGGAQVLWFATKFNEPAWANWRLKRITDTANPAPTSLTALDLLWGAAWVAQNPAAAALPLAKYFRGAEIVTLRSAWNDPEATFVGFKGGDNQVNHGHLDLGTFVLDAAGHRWAMDLGPDDYNLPGYFGKTRWDFYRCRTEGHNALVINPGKGPDQVTSAKAKITQFASSDGSHFAIADLTAAYAETTNRARRGVFLRGRSALVQDEVSAKAPSEVWWFMHTTAKVEINGSQALLALGGKTLKMRILQPSGARFEVMEATPLPTSPQLAKQQVVSRWSKHDSSNARKLAIHLTGAKDVTIAVAFDVDSAAPSTVVPLSEWRLPSDAVKESKPAK